MSNQINSNYTLYLSSISANDREVFKEKYSRYFNQKLSLNYGDSKKKEGKEIYDKLGRINEANALIIYIGVDEGSHTKGEYGSIWEQGYFASLEKPIIAIIEEEKDLERYEEFKILGSSIDAIVTSNEDVEKNIYKYEKLSDSQVLHCENPEQFESKIIDFLNEESKSIYSRIGSINYRVDKIARDLFSDTNLRNNLLASTPEDTKIKNEISKLDGLRFKSDKDYLKICGVERGISHYISMKIQGCKTSEVNKKVEGAISSVISKWEKPKNLIIECLSHSIQPPFQKIKGRKQGVKKTRPAIFIELQKLATKSKKHEKNPKANINSLGYPVGAIIELYNWMNTYSIDDVFDNSEKRQGHPTVWAKFSRRDAIFTGILGHLLTLKYLINMRSINKKLRLNLTELMNTYNLKMYLGQVLDLSLTMDSKKKKDLVKKSSLEKVLDIYIRRIYGICGGFYETIGALVSKTMGYRDKFFEEVSMYYGIIQMIRNDLGDYIEVEKVSKLSKGMKGKSHSDIEEGKVDFPYIISMYSDNLNKKDKEFLLNCLNTKLYSKDKKRINKLLWKSGSFELTVDLITVVIKHVKEKISENYVDLPNRKKRLIELFDITDKILKPFENQARKNNWQKYQYSPKILENLSEKILNLEKLSEKEKISILKTD